MPELRDVTLDNIGGGVAPAHFERELGRILKNIHDPNTDAKEERTLTLTFKFTPASDRESISVKVGASSKLAKHKPSEATVFLGQRGQDLVAVAYNPRQMDLLEQEQRDPDVHPLKERRATT